MITRKFPRAFMLDVIEGGNDATIISDTLSGHYRWSVGHTLIFEYEGKAYQAKYRVPATESQDESPWEYEDEVECIEVRPVEKTVVVYEPVEEAK